MTRQSIGSSRGDDESRTDDWQSGSADGDDIGTDRSTACDTGISEKIGGVSLIEKKIGENYKLKTGENEKFEQEFAWIIIKFWFHKTILDSPPPPESFLSSEMAKLKKMSRGVPVFCNFLVLNSIFFL